MSIYEASITNPKKQLEFYKDLSEQLQRENKKIKKQLEEYQLQNVDLRADIMIQKMAFPNELIKDKTFYDLYNMPTYEELLVQQKEFIKYLEDEIYSIEPKGTGINYNCEYDSEEDYIRAMKEQSKLIVLKEVLQKYKEIISDKDASNSRKVCKEIEWLETNLNKNGVYCFEMNGPLIDWFHKKSGNHLGTFYVDMIRKMLEKEGGDNK